MNFEERIKEVVAVAIQETNGENKTMENICNHVNWDYVNQVATDTVKTAIMNSKEYEEYKGNLIRITEFTENCGDEENILYKIDVYDNDYLVITQAEMLQLKELIKDIEVKV